MVHHANEKWWTDINTGERLQRNKGELLMLCVSELAEALEGDRKNLQDDKLPQYKMYHVELVDTLIRVFDLLGSEGVNVDEIFEAKMEFNRNRKDHSREHRLTQNGKKY